MVMQDQLVSLLPEGLAAPDVDQLEVSHCHKRYHKKTQFNLLKRGGEQKDSTQSAGAHALEGSTLPMEAGATLQGPYLVRHSLSERLCTESVQAWLR